MNQNRYSVSQIATATKTNENTLRQLMTRYNIYPQENTVTAEELTQLIDALDTQQAQCLARAKAFLASAVEQYTLLIDTCALLHDRFPDLLQELTPLLRQQGKTLIVPSGVVAELRRIGKTKPPLKTRVNQVLSLLSEGVSEGTVKIYGGNDQTFADNQFLTVVTGLRTSSALMVITRDTALSKDILALNCQQSVRTAHIEVVRISRYGFLSRFRDPDNSASFSSGEFGSVSQPSAQAQRLLPTTKLPISGDCVYGSDSVYPLGKELASGGEGVIYELPDGSVAKIYRTDKRTEGRLEKLRLMVGKQVDFPGICWPLELLYNEERAFVGYRMHKAQGTQLQLCVFHKALLEKHFPDWQKKDTVRLCVTILEKISALHKQGVILGDINPANILVVSPEEVWLVDCDSYQIGSYPCPVGTVRFTAPELQKKNFATLLRSPGNEYFAIATLLFMIMLPGKSPYAQQGGEDLSELICAMDFPYPCGDNGSDKTPEGSWRFQWSHLPRYIKDYFYGTFQRGGAYSTEKTRLSTDRWLFAFRYYYGLLNDGKLERQDPQSVLLFPYRWKITEPSYRIVWQKAACEDCGTEFEIMLNERDYCCKRGLELPSCCPACRCLRRHNSVSGSDQV